MSKSSFGLSAPIVLIFCLLAAVLFFLFTSDENTNNDLFLPDETTTIYSAWHIKDYKVFMIFIAVLLVSIIIGCILLLFSRILTWRKEWVFRSENDEENKEENLQERKMESRLTNIDLRFPPENQRKE